MNPDDRAKTGCAGIAIPLACLVYAAFWFATPESLSSWAIRPIRGADAAALGVSIIGLALFVHAFGFVPYQRYPVLRWLLVLGGVSLFFKGIFS
jgi:hypothetical protein